MPRPYIYNHASIKMAAESLEFQQTLEAFSDEQQTSCTELFSKLQDLTEVTLDFKEIQKCLDGIHPSQVTDPLSNNVRMELCC